MAVGSLLVTPETIHNLPFVNFNDARLFVGCYVKENEKQRTHSENGPELFWKNTLTFNITEGENYLYIELINESPNNGGVLANATVSLSQVFNQGTETQWVQLKSSSNGQPFGELKLNFTFNGTVSSVTSSYSHMDLGGGQQATFQQTTTTSYHQNVTHDSRSSSYSSLGPANPIPANYGVGTPPPFQPQAPISYNTNSSMPGANISSNNLMDSNGVVNSSTMSENEFEHARATGTLPPWAKYGGGALAAGLAAVGAHEIKESHSKKDKNSMDKLFGMASGYLQTQQQHGQSQQHQGGSKNDLLGMASSLLQSQQHGSSQQHHGGNKNDLLGMASSLLQSQQHGSSQHGGGKNNLLGMASSLLQSQQHGSSQHGKKNDVFGMASSMLQSQTHHSSQQQQHYGSKNDVFGMATGYMQPHQKQYDDKKYKKALKKEKKKYKKHGSGSGSSSSDSD